MTGRYDSWIIWGHGLRFIRPVASMIRDSGFLRIDYIRKIPVKINEEFIKGIYKEDTYPWPHLVAKTRYLLSTPQEIGFILTKNTNVNEIWRGKGDFHHKECANIKKLKDDIRNRFNPKYPNGRRTENHMIHGTDFEKQTIHLLSMFNFPTIEYFQDKALEILKPNRFFSIDELYGNIIDRGPIPIMATPHYAYLKGNKGPYIDYINKHWGRSIKDDHFPEAFDKLFGKIKDNPSPDVIIRTYNYQGKPLIADGLHRACILKALGKAQIEVQHG